MAVIKEAWMIFLCMISFGRAGCFGETPTNLGVQNGRLAPCPESPNCASTYEADNENGLEPLPLLTTPAEAMAAIHSVMEAQLRTEIVTQEGDYLHAISRSPRIGFVDDVEVYIDREAGQIHFRSASRLGYDDRNVNRKRIQSVQQALKAAQEPIH